MTTVRNNRRFLGFIFWVGLAFVVVHFVMLWPMPIWGVVFMVPVYVGLGYLGYIYFADPPILTIGPSELVIYRWPRSPVRIQLSQIKEAHIREPWGCDGRSYFLEISLHSHTPETERQANSWVTRRYLKEAADYSAYSPPEEPFYVHPLAPLKISDAELVAKIEAAKAEYEP